MVESHRYLDFNNELGIAVIAPSWHPHLKETDPFVRTLNGKTPLIGTRGSPHLEDDARIEREL